MIITSYKHYPSTREKILKAISIVIYAHTRVCMIVRLNNCFILVSKTSNNVTRNTVLGAKFYHMKNRKILLPVTGKMKIKGHTI